MLNQKQRWAAEIVEMVSDPRQAFQMALAFILFFEETEDQEFNVAGFMKACGWKGMH